MLGKERISGGDCQADGTSNTLTSRGIIRGDVTGERLSPPGPIAVIMRFNFGCLAALIGTARAVRGTVASRLPSPPLVERATGYCYKLSVKSRVSRIMSSSRYRRIRNVLHVLHSLSSLFDPTFQATFQS